MTLDELRSKITTAEWFLEPGRFQPLESPQLALRDLSAWAREDAVADEEAERVAAEMEWLPTQRDQDDLIWGRRLDAEATTAVGKAEVNRVVMDIYKVTLGSLHGIPPNDVLRVGVHDFTNAAKGAAAYAARRAALELIAGKEVFWCPLITLYQKGHWPCGMTAKGKLIVF